MLPMQKVFLHNMIWQVSVAVHSVVMDVEWIWQVISLKETVTEKKYV